VVVITPVDDPRLTPDLGRHPAGDERHERQRPGDRRGHVEEPLRRQRAPPPQDEQVDDRQEREQRADADHRLEREAGDVDRWPVDRGHRVQTPHRVVEGMERQQREQVRDRDPEGDPPVVVPAEDVLGRAPGGLRQALQANESDCSWLASRR
jgi:hypothetical protein